MIADVSHIQLVENFHKSFILLNFYLQLLLRNHALILVSLFFLFLLFISTTLLAFSYSLSGVSTTMAPPPCRESLDSPSLT
jgi:hypothetical protein